MLATDLPDAQLLADPAQLDRAGATWTAREICQQPRLWQQLAQQHRSFATELASWLAPLLAQPQLRIIFTGAGTSAYIGEALAAHIQHQLPLAGQRAVAISTTDIVSHPQLYLGSKQPTLLVSYGRSGNSPESVAAVQLADQLLPDCRHLLISCNAAGKLAQYAQQHPANSLLYLMPDAAHDQSFAMTSSFSCMYLATLLTFAPDQQALSGSIALAQQILDTRLDQIRAQALQPCQRMVFLGAGPLKAIAQEAALKYLELTAGQVLSSFETPLGFRHGPKSLVNSSTQILLLQSSDRYSQQYDLDLLRELQQDKQALAIDVLAQQQLAAGTALADVWLGLPFVLWCQALAFYKALQLNVSPDNPCPGGQVNRVVQGVRLYPFTE
ncbi:MAG: SIS domain-containing protein [Gammaproteobacteria bacterium]|nr:SIS domain-containing protein [Gammaproteobacteria bacterium]MBU1555173.1 SIS domain-containing protein [Gammaproteobacteria bacterium]MBU2068948.1 SIS domain-containing protein [Gammaproteobacteria bacterium]MBU2181454.1 SIS domain-containing protein [Gammaproteobacteria bacterium]MBU2203800.1 SIS domain-containing protein [Gammaproteobacteria bacterium]